MPGIPNIKKGISLVGISSAASAKQYPTGSNVISPGTDGYILQSDSTSPTGFSWVSASSGGGGGGAPSGPAGGDLAGTYPNPTLAVITASTTVGSSTIVPVVSIDNKGRVTSLTSATITGVPPSGYAGGDLTGSYPNPTLKEITTATTSGSATAVPIITVDTKGRVTTLTSASIQIAESQVTNLTTDLATITTNVATAQSDATQALIDAASAQSTANAAQPGNTNLTALSNVTGAADKVPYFTGTTTMTTSSFTSFGRSIVGLADSGSVKSLLNLTKTDVGLANVDNTSDANKSVLYATTAGSATPSGNAGGDLTGSYPNPTLKDVTTATTYISTTTIPSITLDAKGRITTLSSASIQIAESQVTNLTTDLSNLQTTASNLSGSYYPLSSSFVTLSSSYYTLSSSFISVSSSVNSLSSSYYPLSSSFYSLSSSYYPFSSSVDTQLSAKVAKAGDTMTGNLIISGTNRIGIGTSSPSYALHMQGTGSTSIIRSDIGFEIGPVPNPTTLSVALLAVTGNVDIGTHSYYVTFVTALGETRFYFGAAGQGTKATTVSGSQQVRITFPTSSDYRVTGRKLYRSKAGGNYWDAYLLVTINDNTTTTYDDNIADSALPASNQFYRENTTTKYFTTNGTGFMLASDFNTAFGFNTLANIYNNTILGGENSVFGASAGSKITSGNKNVLIGAGAGANITTGYDVTAMGHAAAAGNPRESVIIGRNTAGVGSPAGSVMIGRGAAQSNTNGSNNTFVGDGAAQSNTSGGNNTCIGVQAGWNLSTGQYNIIIGNWIYAVANNSHATLNIGNTIYGTGMYSSWPPSATPSGGSIAISVQTPTARLHLPAGATAASSAPLKFMSGSLLTSPESGSVEFNGDKLYLTITSSAARKEISLNDAAISVDRVVYTTTNGRLTGSFIQVTPASNFVNIVGSLNVSSSLTVTGSVTIANNRIDDAWTSYTPTWSSDGASTPTLGNGTITGAYKQIGKTVFVRVKLTLGSTSTTGDGAWTISLPVTAANADGVQMPCSLLDSGVSWYAGIVNGGYKGQTDRTAIITTASPAGAVSSTIPFAWGSSDSIQFNGSYEAA